MPGLVRKCCSRLCPSGYAAQDVLFEPGTYSVQSRYKNFIAFQLEMALLLRVLKAAGANNAEQVEVKLALRTVQVADAANPESKPFLSFICRGPDLYMVQDLPISKPYPPSGEPGVHGKS